jgi:hypothetical protein
MAKANTPTPVFATCIIAVEGRHGEDMKKIAGLYNGKLGAAGI